MMQWAVDAATESRLFDLIVVSTDDKDIERLALHLGCYVHKRDTDDGTTGTQEIAVAALRALEIEYGEVCTLYPCSPLLDWMDLKYSSEAMDAGWCGHLVSTYPEPTPRDAGCFYWQDIDLLMEGERLWLRPTIAYPLPANRCIDINVESDWLKAEQMFDALEGK